MTTLPYQTHSATSAEAAERAEPRVGTDQARVLDFLRFVADGATDEEMQIDLGMNASTQRPRRIELVSVGLVVDSGETRKTRSGRRATVWKAAPPAAEPAPRTMTTGAIVSALAQMGLAQLAEPAAQPFPRREPAAEPAPCGKCGGSGQVGAPCPDGPKFVGGVLVSCAVMHSRPCPSCRPGGVA